MEILESKIQTTSANRKLRENVDFLAQWHKDMVRNYNSASEKEKRHRNYEQIQAIGRLRKQAFCAGEDMSKYPLPWERAL